MKFDTKELATITVLYVEDDEMVRSQTSALFNKIFKKVYIANDGEEGLELFKNNESEIEIIVSDINMPNLNGMDMIKQIKQLASSNVPVIFTTAHTDTHNLQNAIDLNINKYISKPLQIKELTANIVNLVLQYRKQKNLESMALSMANTVTKDSEFKQNCKEKLALLTQKIKHYEVLVDSFLFKLETNKLGNIEEVSTKFCTFFGFPKSEMIGSSINDLKCESCEGETFQQLMLKAIHTKKTISSKSTFILKDGTKIDFDVILTAKYADDGLVNGYTLYLDLV